MRGLPPAGRGLRGDAGEDEAADRDRRPRLAAGRHDQEAAPADGARVRERVEGGREDQVQLVSSFFTFLAPSMLTTAYYLAALELLRRSSLNILQPSYVHAIRTTPCSSAVSFRTLISKKRDEDEEDDD